MKEIATIKNKIIEIVRNIKNINTEITILDDDNLINKFNLDSMDLVELSVKLSKEFGYRFGEQDDDVLSLARFRYLVALIMANT
jgi:acyl carrier protein